jgi:Zn-dependent peptidase ImmA (M78 family)
MTAAHDVEGRVKELLEEAGIRSAPVDPVALADRLGVEVRPEIASDDISGGLYRVGGTAVIGVNARHHPNRQRFTIAHELGHLLLHEQDEFVDHGYVMEGTDLRAPRFMRNQISGEAIDVREMEANAFAANLLMPRHFIEKEVRDLPLPVRSDEVENLARKFKVSQQAMTFRLQNLQVPLDHA